MLLIYSHKIWTVGNYSQYLVIMKKNIKKNAYMCMSHFAVQWRLVQHCKSTIYTSIKNKVQKKVWQYSYWSSSWRVYCLSGIKPLKKKLEFLKGFCLFHVRNIATLKFLQWWDIIKSLFLPFIVISILEAQTIYNNLPEIIKQIHSLNICINHQSSLLVNDLKPLIIIFLQKINSFHHY